MTHPLHAEDDVGRIASNLATWVLQLATALMIASRKGDTEARLAAATEAFEVWRKVTRRMAQLERIAPKCAEAGYARDDDMQDVLEVITARRQQRAAE